MNERDIAKYAAMLATGVIVEDQLADLIGDDTIVKKIITVAAASAVTSIASDMIEDAVDGVFDVIGNVFDWD